MLPGMADFQVLPPGLSSVSHNHLPVNPEDFQITGTHVSVRSKILVQSICTSVTGGHESDLTPNLPLNFVGDETAVMSSSLLLDVTSFHSLEPLDDSFVNRDHPSFLPPSIFSKFDKPTNYG